MLDLQYAGELQLLSDLRNNHFRSLEMPGNSVARNSQGCLQKPRNCKHNSKHPYPIDNLYDSQELHFKELTITRVRALGPKIRM